MISPKCSPQNVLPKSTIKCDHGFYRKINIFRQTNIFFTKEVSKELISRTFFVRDRILQYFSSLHCGFSKNVTFSTLFSRKINVHSVLLCGLEWKFRQTTYVAVLLKYSKLIWRKKFAWQWMNFSIFYVHIGVHITQWKNNKFTTTQFLFHQIILE